MLIHSLKAAAAGASGAHPRTAPRRAARQVASLICACLLAGLVLAWIAPVCGDSPWNRADEGLWVAEFDPPPGFEKLSSKITVIKIDPKFYSLRLLCSSELGREKLTARDWCEKYKLTAAVNAGMFQEDGLTSVGFMQNYSHMNNPRIAKTNTVLAFNPVDAGLPEVRIIDRECDDFQALRKQYHTFIQSIRMISCEQQNVWTPQPAKWSILATATDAGGSVLFLFSNAPCAVHDFIDAVLALPLSIRNAMYLEGGPQASLYFSVGNMTVERNGGWEAGNLNENSPFNFSFPIPNVIGVVKKTS